MFNRASSGRTHRVIVPYFFFILILKVESLPPRFKILNSLKTATSVFLYVLKLNNTALPSSEIVKNQKKNQPPYELYWKTSNLVAGYKANGLNRQKRYSGTKPPTTGTLLFK